MRPTFVILDLLASLSRSTGSMAEQTLLTAPLLGYDRCILPVGVCFDQGNVVPFQGEAEMERKRPEKGEHPPQDMASAKSEPETREQRLARIRAEIEAGEYETPEKLEIAIGRMLGAMTE